KYATSGTATDAIGARNRANIQCEVQRRQAEISARREESHRPIAHSHCELLRSAACWGTSPLPRVVQRRRQIQPKTPSRTGSFEYYFRAIHQFPCNQR